MLKRIGACTLALGPAVYGTALAQSVTDRAENRGLPTFELMGVPITPVQAQVVASPHVKERFPTATLMVAGMPASPHQAAVLTPRRKAPKTAAKAR